MAGEVGTAYVRLRPQTTGFQSEATSSLKRTLVGIGTAVGGFFAAQQAFGFVKQSVQTAASIQKSQEAIQATMGKSSKVVEHFGRTAANNFAISAKDSDAFAARIGLLGQNIGLTNAQSANMTVQLEKLAGSFGMVKGEDPTPYLDALSSAVIGNTRGLKQMGIAINSTNELAAAERLGFIKTVVDANKVAAARAKVAEYTAKVSEEEKKYGKQSSQTLGATASLKSAQDGLNKALNGSSSSTVSSLTAAQKAQVIMSVATSHLSSLQKEASAHSGDLANQTIRLSAEWSNAKDEIGTALLPVVTELAKAFATDLPGAMHAFAQAFASAMGIATPLMAPVIAGVRSLSTALYANRSVLVTAVGSMVAFKAATEAVSEVQSIGKDIAGAYNTVMEAGRVAQAGGATAEEAAASAVDQHTAALTANTAAIEAQTSAQAGLAAATGTAIAGMEAETLASIDAATAEEAYGAAVEQAVFATTQMLASNVELGTAYAVLSGSVAEATAAQVAYDAALAATEVEAAGALASVGTLGTGLVALAGGPLTVALAGVAALGIGILYLTRGATPLQNALNRLGGTFSRLNVDMAGAEVSRKHLTQVMNAIPEQRLAVAQAKLSVEQAKANLNNKALNTTTLQHKQNVLALKSAEQNLHDAQRTLNGSEKAEIIIKEHLNSKLKDELRDRQRLSNQIFDAGKKELQAAIARQAEQSQLARSNLSDTEKQGERTRATAEAVRKWAGDVQGLAAKQKNLSPTMQHNVDLLIAFGKKTGEIPNKHITDIILNIKKPKEQLAKLLQDFAGIAPKGHLFGVHLGTSFSQGTVEGMFKNAPKEKAQISDNVKGIFKQATSVAGISSPSQLFRTGVGQPISDGIIKGIDDRTQALQNQIQKTLQAQLKPATAEAKGLGTGILQGILQPLGSLAQNLQTTIVDAANAAISGAKHALGIKSPSTLFANQVGKPIADGILHGMGGLKAGLVNEIKTAAQAAMAASGGIAGGPSGTAATGANQAIGRQMMLAQGWGADQWGSLQALWNKESGWNQFAKNASSGAFGIPQELNHNVSAAYLAGDVRAQIAWGLDYIRVRYGSPAAAWAHEVANNWYGDGGIVKGPYRGAPVLVGAHAGETILPTHKSNSSATTAAGVNIENLTVLSTSPHLWGQASDVMNAVARKVHR